MLNFYNYYGKIHPELMKKLKEIEEKTSGNNNVLVIRPLSTKDTPEPFDDAYAKGETIYYDESKIEGDVTLSSSVLIEISDLMAYHILNDIDKIIFYFTDGTPFEGLIYEKRRIRGNILYSLFYHISHDTESPDYTDYVTDTIECGIYGTTEEDHFSIRKVGHAM